VTPRAVIDQRPTTLPVPALDPVATDEHAGARRWALGTLALVLGLLAARLAYLAWWCPYTLIEDEAHYWEWSRRLDWSYYTKGPGIALAIRAATSVLGQNEFAVRSVAAVSSAIATGATALLARAVSLGAGARGVGRARGAPDKSRRAWRIAFFAACAVQLAPAMEMLGVLSTIDGPYLACWAVATLGAWFALTRGSPAGWVTLGLGVGLGFIFKYTILLLLPGLAVFALVSRAQLAPAKRRLAGPAMALGLASLGLIPVLVWNAQNGWGTIHHLLGHLGVQGGDMPVRTPADADAGGGSLVWVLEFIGTQLGMVGPGIVLAAMGIASIRHESDPGRRAGKIFLAGVGLPLLLFYFALSFIAEGEGNWPVAAYITLLALAGWTAADAMADYRAKVNAWLAIEPGPDGRRPWMGRIRSKPETYGQVMWHVTVGFGLVAGAGMLRMDLAARIPGPTESAPVGRFMGADALAAHAAELALGLERETGRPAFFASQHYGRASQLAFYLPRVPGAAIAHPDIVCTSSRMGGRVTQYDKWADSSPERPDLIGRPAVLLGATLEQWRGWFDRVEPLPPETGGHLRGESKKTRPAFLGWGYRGDPSRRTSKMDAGAAPGGWGGGGGRS
jgi:hypothetical protein